MALYFGTALVRGVWRNLFLDSLLLATGVRTIMTTTTRTATSTNSSSTMAMSMTTTTTTALDCVALGYCEAKCDLARTGGPVGPYNQSDGNWTNTANCIDTIHLSHGCSMEVATGKDGRGHTFVFNASSCMAIRYGGPGRNKVRSIRVFRTVPSNNTEHEICHGNEFPLSPIGNYSASDLPQYGDIWSTTHLSVLTGSDLWRKGDVWELLLDATSFDSVPRHFGFAGGGGFLKFWVPAGRTTQIIVRDEVKMGANTRMEHRGKKGERTGAIYFTNICLRKVEVAGCIGNQFPLSPFGNYSAAGLNNSGTVWTSDELFPLTGSALWQIDSEWEFSVTATSSDTEPRDFHFTDGPDGALGFLHITVPAGAMRKRVVVRDAILAQRTVRFEHHGANGDVVGSVNFTDICLRKSTPVTTSTSTSMPTTASTTTSTTGAGRAGGEANSTSSAAVFVSSQPVVQGVTSTLLGVPSTTSSTTRMPIAVELDVSLQASSLNQNDVGLAGILTIAGCSCFVCIVCTGVLVWILRACRSRRTLKNNLPPADATGISGELDGLGDLDRTPSFPSEVLTSLPSLRRPYVQIESTDQKEFRAALMAELVRWQFPTDDALQHSFGVVQRLAHLLCQAGAGALVIVAPKSQLTQLNLETTDMGYLTRRLRAVSCTKTVFENIFSDFAAHTPNDCWPDDYKDEAARGLPKDGALLLLPAGQVLKCAVKIIGLPLAPCQWSGHGTRHETALAVAAKLEQAVVLVHSSSGHMHCLLGRDRGNTALSLSSANTALSAAGSDCSSHTGNLSNDHTQGDLSQSFHVELALEHSGSEPAPEPVSEEEQDKKLETARSSKFSL